MTLVRVNLDTAASEPDTRLIDRLMRERPMPIVRGAILRPSGNVVVPVAR